MGVHENIGINKFPKQADRSKFCGVGSSVRVCFNYDTSKILKGVIVRDDREEPFQTIIKLEDGRYVLSTECQYSASDESEIKEEVIIKQLENGVFDVHYGNKNTEELTFDEMLGIVAQITMPTERRTLNWLKTKEQHDAFRNRLLNNK